MTMKIIVLIVSALVLSTVHGSLIDSVYTHTCMELCASCNGVASLVNNRCECNIADNTELGAECVNRMKREAVERGLDMISCDLSSDKRFTRCTLGLKKSYGKNDIEQVAKYFMNNGPITGSIFKAPPYTLKGKTADCIGSSKIITQPIETVRAPAYDDSMPILSSPQQYVSSPGSDCVGASQIITQPKETMPVVFSPPSEQYVSSPRSDCVGASQIITQPKETMSAPDVSSYQESIPSISIPRVSIGNCGSVVGQSIPSSDSWTSSPMVGDINLANLPGANASPISLPRVPVNPGNSVAMPNITPTLLQLLARQFSQPLLGIPQALKTVTETPGINQLVSAPGNLVNGILHHLGGLNTVGNVQQVYPNESDDTDLTVGDPQIELTSGDSNTGSSITAQTSPFNIPGLSYIVGAPAPSQISYMQPMPLSAMPMIQSPMVGSMSPAYSSFIPHMPMTTYIVGTPFGMPFIPNYGSGAPTVAMFNPIANVGGSSRADENVGSSLSIKPSNIEIPVAQPKQIKKICKKSNKAEISRKMTRDIKESLESVTDEVKLKEVEEQMKEKIDAAGIQIEQTTTEIPKIDRTTTQSPVTEKTTGQKLTIEKSKPQKEFIERIKPVKENLKKTRAEKKRIVEQQSEIKK